MSSTPALVHWPPGPNGRFLRGCQRSGGELAKLALLTYSKKQNVFDDFIGAAEWFVQNHYTTPARLGIIGGSNGGLLMGAMMTQRPDLFGAIVCGAPLLDMLRFQKMSVGAWWVSEYGSADDPKQFEYLRKYSPYHNVRQGTEYPSVMFVTGDADTRVDPAHARKMAALMQSANNSANLDPAALRHQGRPQRHRQREQDCRGEQVDQVSFLASRLAVKLE